MKIVIIYFLMLAFDLAVMAGCFYLVDQRAWNNWTILLGMVICLGSYPMMFIKALEK